MGYVINAVKISNFKYVTAEKELVISANKADMVVLDGQNGYGKTTFFDSLELLFTDSIEHVTSVENRKTSEYSIEELVFDLNRDVIIQVELENELNDKYIVKRVFECHNDFKSKIYCNNEEKDDTYLYEKFGFDKNSYGMGIYMPQTKSLAFLEQRKKDRKNLVAELVNTNSISDKVSVVNETMRMLSTKIDSKKQEYDAKIDDITIKINGVQKDIDASKDISNAGSSYKSLFPDEDYYFDKEDINIDKSYLVTIEPLNKIKKFIIDYDGYKRKKQNDKIRKVLSLPKQVYLKHFYSNVIEEINKHTIEKINSVEETINYKDEILSGNFYIDKNICETVGVNQEYLDMINDEITQYTRFNDNLGETEESIIKLNESRKALITCYNQRIEQDVKHKDVCPLCGVKHDNIEKTFNDVEKILISSIEESNKTKQLYESKLKKSFNDFIIMSLDEFINCNQRIYNNYQQLKDCINLDVKEIDSLLKEYNISFCSEDMIVSIDTFDGAYKKITEILNCKIIRETIIISPETMELYNDIANEYYKNEEPKHSLDEIDQKIRYIANCYSSESKKKMKELQDELEEVNEKAENFKNNSESLLNNVKALSKIYSDSYKTFQTKLVEAIRLPVLIYSGKIIQNYPLGLGIETKIAANQLTFEPVGKDGTDVINILSTGQLNGLAISIVLAIRNVYGKKEGLDFLLIDDPLQTIDDISAISLADLLINSNITQIIFSTHEDRKTNMFAHKYRKRGLDFKVINMKQKYLNYKGYDE